MHTPVGWVLVWSVGVFNEGLISTLAQTVNNLPAMQENEVRSLGYEDPLEEGMAPHSSILAWRIPRTEEPELGLHMGL